MFRALLYGLVLAFVYVTPSSAATGTVTGTVTSSSTAAPVAGASVALCTPSVDCQYTSTNAAGVYTLSVDPGTYYLLTFNWHGLIDEIYDNIQCPGRCQESTAVSTGAPVVVTSGGTISGKDFALDLGGSITGTIVNATTSAPVHATVYVYTVVNGNVTLSTYGSSNDAGVYTASGLPTGTYYAFTYNSIGLINEIYDDVQCHGTCASWQSPSVGTPIAVTAGATTAGTNFALQPGGSITGTVRDSVTSAPLQYVWVYAAAATSSGVTASAAAAQTNAAGVYTAQGLPTGNYYAYTWNGDGYINKLYDNVQCVGDCSDLIEGTLIPVTAGAVTSGKDFGLERGGTITGTVTSAVTSAPLNGVYVRAYARSSTGAAVHARETQTDASGVYSLGSLPTGVYYVVTNAGSGFVDEIFDDIPCMGSCTGSTAIATGTGIAVTAGATTSGKNFALEVGGGIAGTVLSHAGSAPLADTYVYVYARDFAGMDVLAGSGQTTASGEYTVSGLPSGTYYAITSQAPGHVNAIYGDVPCLGYCAGATAISAGTPIPVTAGNTTTGIQFVLGRGGSISGTVRTATDSAPLAGVAVYAYRNVGDGYANYAGNASTSGSGAYTISGLPAGDYYLLTSVSEAFQNQVYGGINCPRYCSTVFVGKHATPVTVVNGATTSGRDFALSEATGRITGTITNAATSTPAEDVYVYLYVRLGAEYASAGSSRSNASGVYEFKGLPSGTYFAVSNSYGKYLDEIYGNVLCLTTCDYGIGAVTTGTPIVVTTGTVTANFDLQPLPASLPPGQPWGLSARIVSGTATFTWEEPYEYGTATDYLLDVGLSPGTTLVSIPVATTTYAGSGVPPGRYFARVRARNSAGVGPATSEYEITINADGSGAPDPPTDVVFFVDGGKIFGSWAAAASGGVATDYVLEVGTASGLSNIARQAVGSRAFFNYEPLPPPGVYFVRVRARNALSISKPSDESMLIIGDAPAPPDPPGNIGVAVDAARTVLIGWTPPRGTLTGYVLEVGTAEGRSDLGVFTLAADPTVLSVAGVPPGAYYFRMRSVNAAGVGVVSYDTTLIVP